MVTLSGMFRRWAIYERDESITPAQRTLLIQLSADYERIAEWVGPDWLASDPSEEVPVSRFLADLGRRDSSTVDLGLPILPKPGNRGV